MPLIISKKPYNKDINILIVDDCEDDIKTLIDVIKKVNEQLHFNIKIDVINETKDLILIYHKYHYIFLDIVFDKEGQSNGIKEAQKITAINPYCNIIFVTHNKQFAIAACSAKPIAFLEKPIKYRNFINLFNLIHLKRNDNWKLEFGNRNNAIIYTSKIIYIEAFNHKSVCTYFDVNDQKVTTQFAFSLIDWHELLELNYLYKVRFRYIVNFLYVLDVCLEYIKFIDGSIIYIPKAAYKETKMAFLKYKTFGGIYD